MWTYALGQSCCYFEFENACSSRFDWERFGSSISYEPSQSDLLIVAGTINLKNSERVVEIYNQMLKPTYVIAAGACAISGGLFAGNTDNIIHGIEKIIPVDIYVPGCPPRPEAFMHGLISLQNKIEDKFNL